MKKNILSLLILISGILISGAIISFADAQTTTLDNIKYPISELGNCQSKAECKVFCDDSQNSDACLAFAKQNNLMSSDEIAVAKKFEDSGRVGPGSCQGQVACEQYCGDSTKLEECTAFAEKNGMMSDQQLQDSKKVVAAIKSGLKPPACSGPKQCNTYCSSSEHMQECMTFSLAAGVVPDNQKEQMQKTLTVLKSGIKPPACKPNPPSQSEQGQNDQPNQSTPPESQSGQGLQACDQYCADSIHVEECVKFSVAIGNMTEEQGQNSIKNGGKGPGGCIGKDACDTFCNNSDNQDTCFNFAKDNGMIPEADLQKMQEGQQKMKDAFSTIPSEVIDCLTSTVGVDVVEKMKTGSVIGRQSGDSINQCFQKFSVWEGTPSGNGPGSDQGGQSNQNQNGQDQQNQNQSNQQIMPWADRCKNNTALACVDEAGKFIVSAKVGSDGEPVCPTGSTAKCGNYQQNNQQGQNQVQQNQPGDKFQPEPGTANPGGQQMPQQAGPGGCKGPEECQKYCDSNPEVCKNFQPQQNQQQNQSGQKLPQQQPGQSNQGVTNVGPCGTGPGTCSGIGPDDINPKNGDNGHVGDLNKPGQNQPNQPEQLPREKIEPNQLNQRLPQQQLGQPNQGVTNVGPCGTGPGTCSGIGPDDINPRNGDNGPVGDPNQPGQQMQPGQQQQQPQQQQMQPQQQPQQQQNPSSPPVSFLKEAQWFLANVLSALK